MLPFLQGSLWYWSLVLSPCLALSLELVGSWGYDQAQAKEDLQRPWAALHQAFTAGLAWHLRSRLLMYFSLPWQKKSKKERELEKQKAEKELSRIEEALMDPGRQPESADEFDRLVLSSPNSSILWLQYMAFHLQATEIEKARAVAERALKTISFRSEQHLPCLQGGQGPAYGKHLSLKF